MIGPKYAETLALVLTSPRACSFCQWTQVVAIWALGRVALSVSQANKQQGIGSARGAHAPAKDPMESELGALVEKKSPEKY